MSHSDFWVRRKAAVQAEAEADLRALKINDDKVRDAELDERPDSEILEELGLPDPDSLDKGDDFKSFLTKAVPGRIRNRALRRLWLTNPVLANVDGLVDYGEDFTDWAKVIEAMQTAYQVGKGMTKHVEEMARQAEAEALAEDADGGHAVDTSDASAVADEGQTEASLAPQSEPVTPAEQPAPSVAAGPVGDAESAVLPRRMRFDFEEVRPEV
jgi:Protein of unknown function (DUF3306)